MKASYLVRHATEADLPTLAAVHLASWRAAYRDLVPEKVLLRRSIEDCLAGWRATLAREPANVTVAYAPDGRIHGVCRAGAVVDAERSAPFEFEVFGLHVPPNSRRRGIGASLLRQALARASRCEGSNSAIVWTLKDLPSPRQSYRRAGGLPVKSGVFLIDAIALAEIAYGWSDLRARFC
jgi:ribosomal protein S18 acetylase RimI-like enzyme